MRIEGRPVIMTGMCGTCKNSPKKLLKLHILSSRQSTGIAETRLLTDSFSLVSHNE